MKAITRFVALVVATAVMASCTMKDQDAPPLTGPSEFGTSIVVEASPDVLQTDGGSQSLVTITARDGSGKPIPNLPLRVEIRVDGTAVDFGSLSARSLVTDSQGRATVRYTAPNIATGVDTGTLVDIAVTPLGSNALNAVMRTTSIRLVPVGVVVPPAGLQPAFTFTPAAPTDNQTVVFDASTSQAPVNNPIAEYRWSFGDGRTATGRTTTHAFSEPGTYLVTLTILDALGRSASTVLPVQVGAGTGPTASAFFTPSAPLPGQQVLFNATASRAATGRTIVAYDWSFGDGATASGVQTAHAYSAVGNYTVLLVVTDDAGRSATTTLSVGVGTGATPSASFVFSPTNPRPAQPITFNASASTAAAGRTITAYEWDFGDASSGSGVQPSHTYAAAGTYVVLLTVTDSTGAKGTTTQSITVTGEQPQASFTFSPTNPTVGTTLFFNASQSSPAPGRTIVSYSWDFGDGTKGTGVDFTKSGGYGAAGTYVVTLTVVDDRGNSAITTRTVTVSNP